MIDPPQSASYAKTQPAPYFKASGQATAFGMASLQTKQTRFSSAKTDDANYYKQMPQEKQALLSQAYPDKMTGSSPYHYGSNNGQFASIVQVPVLQTLREAEQKAAKETPGKPKSKLEKFVLLGPALMLSGGLSWILKDRNRIVNPILKTLGKELLPEVSKGAKELETAGKFLLASGSGLLSLNGIAAGIVSDQPSMLTSNVMQLIPSILIGFVKKDYLKNFAASLMMLTGAMYSTGFANELKNKEKGTPTSEIRRYDMSRFKSAFDRNNPASFSGKAGVVFQEFGKMLGFTLGDHAKLASNAYHNLTRHFMPEKATPTPGAPVPSVEQNPKPGISGSELKEWVNKPTADKSQIAAIFMILGALPIVLLTHKNPKIGENAVLKTLKTLGMAFANLSLFSIAIHRDDIKGKAPLLGIPLSVFGMGNSTNGLRVGMGYSGESINSLFFSDVAVNGLKTGEKKTSSPTPSSPMPQGKENPHKNPFATAQA